MRTFNTNTQEISERSKLNPGEYLCVVKCFREPFVARESRRIWLPVSLTAIGIGSTAIEPVDAPDLLFEYNDEEGFAPGFAGAGRWHEFVTVLGLHGSGDLNEMEFLDASLNVLYETYKDRLSVKKFAAILPQQIEIVKKFLRERKANGGY